MSFRLRIFLLVLLVAGTAIGATAWMTLSLTSREVYRVDQVRVTEAREQHEEEIVGTIRRFAVLHGRWPGVDAVVGDLAERTGLHIRLETREGEALVDSDHLEQKSTGPVQLQSTSLDPIPWIDQATQEAARRIGTARDREPEVVLRTGERLVTPPPTRARPALPADLFGPLPPVGDPTYRAYVQVVQYRAALVAVRCLGESSAWDSALALEQSPYLGPDQRTASPACVDTGTDKVSRDTGWLEDVWAQLAECDRTGEAFIKCLTAGFGQAASTTTAVPVEIFFGVGQETDFAGLRRPALIGATALLVAAAVGTAWIARRVSRPVRLLTGASLQLASGRLDVRVPTHGQDDLARLSGAFNAMAEALQRSEERQRRLVADVAHELRTPLSNLRGYLEGLADGVIEPSPELFASLHEETLLQRRILDDLQVLALAEAGELGYAPVPLDLSELTETAATVHRAVAQNAGVEVVVDAPEPVEVCADPDRMRQVLGNLMSNAIRYTDAGGRVELRVARDGPDAVLTVRDTGVGMNPEEVSRVFDRFWRADPARHRATGGSGLGLTIVRRIVADQGGDVTATSEPGLGTTFTVRLPAVTDIATLLDK
ncbi:sensor histidine kinase [Actinoplanes utahensis]|uniref:histidine kinase n=1 Tax=Actinoplanes utahensis TaxID=1869 RepID=A0A0A6UB31_ACTUT|nr:ATP-binding protein [Actinoplanes utahensis]KHD73245.1 histidine kinase [Actinoplanes utahensis]GIF27485.1 hypothetical protein Aut01nite_04710 [Actinoplanes utahensis]